MSSTYGENLKLSIFGQSHGPAIGMTLDGIPAGLPVDLAKLQEFLNRRAPGQAWYATPRKEEDAPEILGGLLNGYTCGSPIAAIIRNHNTRSSDYSQLKDCPRPGHADYTAQIKYDGYQDVAGGGHFSGRLTAPMCIAGGLCKQWLSMQNIQVHARISSIGNCTDSPEQIDWTSNEFPSLCPDFPVISPEARDKMEHIILQAQKDGDSVGGIVECVVFGLPQGIGGPLFGGIEGKLAHILYAIPAVKGVEFGAGFSASKMLGSENNDAFTVENGKILCKTNHAGGILGGITTGMPMAFRVAFKPTPSISRPQTTVRLSDMTEQTLQVQGRHDPCIVPRAVPVVEAASAIAIFDALLSNNKI